MTIRVTCICGKQLAVKDEYAGRRIKCPQCQKAVSVPRPADEVEAAADEWDETTDEDDAPPRRTAAAGRRGPSSARGRGKSGSKGRKQTTASNRGLIIGLSAGGGLIVVALLAWLLWPGSKADDVVVNPSGTEAATANSTDSGTAASGTIASGATASGTPAVASSGSAMPGGATSSSDTTVAPSTPIAPTGPAPEVAMPRTLARLPDEVVKDAPFDVNQFWVSVPAEQNAAPFYLDALYEFHPSVEACFPADVRQQRSTKVARRFQRSYRMQVVRGQNPSQANPAELDSALADHAVGFEKLAAAQQRPRCVFETGWDIPAIGSLIIAGREVARLSQLKVERDIERNDFDAAIRTTGMLLRFSRDLRVRTPLGVQFLADSIDTVADSSLVTPILKSSALTAAQTTELLRLLQQHDAELQTLNPALIRLRADYVLRRLLLHQVQHGTDEFSPARVKSAFGSTSDSLGAAMLASVNADKALAEALRTELPRPEMGQMLDVVARSMKPADYEAGVRILKEKYQVQANVLGQSFAVQSAAYQDWMKQNQAAMASFMASVQSAVPAGTPPAQQAAAALPILEKSLAEEKTPRGQLLLALWASKFENDMGDFPLCGVDLRGTTRRSALLALAALRHWYATHSEPPTDLASVCKAAGLSDVPRDFYSDGPVRMLSFTMDSPPIQYPHGRPTDKPEKFLAGEWVIYSVGPDGIDDRAASDWAYHPGAKGDWPFSLGQPQNRFPVTPGAPGR